jgi:DNA-binding NtrC family response regulator
MRRLMAHKWPGNVRQLENIIERALALSGGRRRIDVDDLPPDIRGEEVAPTLTPGLPESGVDLPALVLGFERHLIDQALMRTEGNRGAAARLLGLKRTTLVEKLRRLSAADPEVALAAGE